MPTRIQRPDQALALAKFYGIKGKLPLQVDEIVVPVHLVGDIRDPLTDPWVPYQGTIPTDTITANDGIAIVNTGRAVVSVDRIVAYGGLGGFVLRAGAFVYPFNVALDPPDDQYDAWQRSFPVPNGASNDSNSGSGNLFRFDRAAAVLEAAFPQLLDVNTGPLASGADNASIVGGMPLMEGPWLLRPGGGLALVCLSDQESIGATFFWRERTLEASEAF